MKYYLSSYEIGDYPDKLVELSGGGTIGCIINSLDFIPKDELLDTPQLRGDDIKELGITSEVLDLRDYFSNPSQLTLKLEQLAGVWIIGGDVFVLRQAMRLSGFDQAIQKLKMTDFLYSGYSAGVCVLAPDLDPYKDMDKPALRPYPEQTETIWEGLGMLNYAIIPHFESAHPEAEKAGMAVQYCKENGISFKPLSDGEVLFGEDINRLSREILVNP